MSNKMDRPLVTVDGRTLMDRPLEPPNFVVYTLISQGLHILAGSPKVGKSWLALWLAVTVAKGEPVWGMSVKQGTTLSISAWRTPSFASRTASSRSQRTRRTASISVRSALPSARGWRSRWRASS